jgi:hypothetical protein
MSPETKVSAVENYTCQKIKIDILTNGKIIQLSISPEEGGTILKTQKTWLNGVTGRPC